MKKALPKKEKKDEAKKTPSRGSSKKVSGSNGKPRYSYPAEKGKDKARADRGKGKGPGRPVADKEQDGVQGDYQPPPRIPEALPIDLGKLCAQLGIQSSSLLGAVQSFDDNPKMGGKAGFVRFFLSQARDFTLKHGLDRGYWERVWDAAVAADGNPD